MRESLKVILWGKEIGRLSWHDARKTSFFMYNPEFLHGSLDVAPLAASIHHPLSTRAIKLLQPDIFVLRYFMQRCRVQKIPESFGVSGINS